MTLYKRTVAYKVNVSKERVFKMSAMERDTFSYYTVKMVTFFREHSERVSFFLLFYSR